MPNLNFYDTDAVKAFLLNTLVENQEAREEAAEANIKAAIAKLAPFNGARQEGVEIGWKDVDRVVAETLLILAPTKTEGGAAE